jgi:hypothetical protein
MKHGPQKRENKTLSKAGLIGITQKVFKKLSIQKAKTQGDNEVISLFDFIMSAIAMFNLKSPSLLLFDSGRMEREFVHNMKMLYGVEHVPCDTYLREILDELDPREIRPAFLEVFSALQRGNILEQYKFLDGYLLSVDGTGVFESEKVHCNNCCKKKHSDGRISYYHQILAGALVHPERVQVIPLSPEPINKQDGSTKNDCETNAANRFFDDLKSEHPRLNVTGTFDALFANAPFINGLINRKFDYIIVAKPGNNPTLFERLKKIKLHEFQIIVGVNIYNFRYINQILLNNTKDSPTVNYFECEAIEIDGRTTTTRHFSWITSHKITESKLYKLMQGGRAKWKIENETFNTLKNQGYQFEHNFGHGKKYLNSVFTLLMMLSFLVDQAQGATDGLFRDALRKMKTYRKLWERIRSFFYISFIESWEVLFKAIYNGNSGFILGKNTS